MMKNILFVIGKYPNYGGTEKVTTVLANNFTSMGCNVHIASFEQPHPESREELAPAIKLHYLEYPVSNRKNIEVLAHIIRNSQIDIIFNQWCLPFSTTRMINKARKGTDCKLLSVLHGVPDKSKTVILAEDAVKAASNGITKSIAKLKLIVYHVVIKQSIRYVYKHSDRYIVLSKGFIQAFRDYTGLKHTPKLLSIGNPITIPTDFENDYISGKKKQILYVGRMDMENKRVNRIIEAWEVLYQEYSDWKLVLVGDGPHKKQLEKYVKEHGIGSVAFTGFVKEEPTEYYKQSSVLMLTSDLEGFGLVIVEGMSYGVIPVIYGSYVSVYDIIDNSKNGFITSMPYSKEKTVKCLKALMDDDGKRQEIAGNALQKSKDYLIENIMKQWYSLFKSL
ncbi:glycosyltransferase [Bacteroides faecium]|nr:glycosyltransferase [Bacteroides faecium]